MKNNFTLKKAMNLLKLSLIFSLLYIFANLAFILFLKLIPENILIFITAPFNALEDLSASYGSVYVGFLFNFLPVFIMLLIASYIYTKNNRLNKFLKPSDVFVVGILASYLSSAVYWLAFKVPSRGTSILAITLLIYFLIYVSTYDFKALFVKRANKNYSKRTKEIAAYITFILLLIIIILVLASNYGLLLVHIIGGLIALSSIEFLILWREHYTVLIKNFKI
ncbi:MAG: hypothetical protein QW292_00780 [Candidatus Parvarchaeota archaeon]